MTVATGSRFEVFKRDGFTCRYCGRTPDAEGVKLEIDHITARAAGGSDEITNLVTSCADCNRGKGAKSLDDKAPSLTQAMANTRERALQLDEYRRWQAALDDVSGDLVERLWDEWVRAFGGDKSHDSETKTTTWNVPYVGVPSKQALMRYIDAGIEVATIIETIDKVRRRWLVVDGHLPDLSDGDVQRYFFGTLKRIQEERDPPSSECDGACGYLEGRKNGAAITQERLRDLFVNHIDHGHETYADVVAALWPDD